MAMTNARRVLLIVIAAVVMGLLFGIREGLPFAWERALVAAAAFAVLGWVISVLVAARKR